MMFLEIFVVTWKRSIRNICCYVKTLFPLETNDQLKTRVLSCQLVAKQRTKPNVKTGRDRCYLKAATVCAAHQRYQLGPSWRQAQCYGPVST